DFAGAGAERHRARAAGAADGRALGASEQVMFAADCEAHAVAVLVASSSWCGPAETTSRATNSRSPPSGSRSSHHTPRRIVSRAPVAIGVAGAVRDRVT